MFKIVHSGGILGWLVGPLLKTGLSLIGNVLKPSPKSVLMPLGSAAAATTDAAIYKKLFRSGFTTPIFLMKNWMIWK